MGTPEVVSLKLNGAAPSPELALTLRVSNSHRTLGLVKHCVGFSWCLARCGRCLALGPLLRLSRFAGCVLGVPVGAS